jgi:hypothetical protein
MFSDTPEQDNKIDRAIPRNLYGKPYRYLLPSGN